MNPALLQQLTLAERYLDIDQPEQAADVLSDLPIEALEVELAWWMRALVAKELGGPSAAMGVLRDGLARFPQSVSLLLVLADAQVENQDLVGAEDTLLRALAVDPENVEAHCDYALVSALAAHPDKAKALLARAAALDPESGDVWVARYRLAYLAGDDRKTRRLTRDLVARSDGQGKAVAMMGIEAMKQGDHRAAWRYLRRATASDASVVEMLGRDVLLEARALNHPLLIPMWPIERFGPGTVWIAAVVGLYGLRAANVDDTLVLYASLAFIAYAVYTWVAPPFVRWLTGAS
ncbi:MAG: tetratricopeptide repeat protein [Myxococcota bacterium]